MESDHGRETDAREDRVDALEDDCRVSDLT
jgi:hypothetical protein